MANLNPTFSIGSGDVVTIKGTKHVLKSPGPQAGIWITEEGKEIDVSEAAHNDKLDHIFNPKGDEVYDRESNKKIVGAINTHTKQLAAAYDEKEAKAAAKKKKKDKKPS